MKHDRILIVRTDRIGDVVLATPLLRELRRTFPHAYIAIMIRPYTQPILENNPYIDEIIIDDPENLHAGWNGFWNRVRFLHSKKFDTALLLLPTERATWMLFLSGIKTRIGVGHKLYELLTFMKTVSRHKYIPLRHEADYCLDLGRAIGVRSDDLSTEVFLTEDEIESNKQRLETADCSENDLIIGIHPGHGHSSPNWTIERYADFANILIKNYNAYIIVTGSEKEQVFQSAFAKLPRQKVSFFFNLPLRELMALIGSYKIFISSSTGPMHIAAALKIPTLSLFCPLTACSWQLWGPQGNISELLLAPDNVCQVTCEKDPHVCTMSDVTLDSAQQHLEILFNKIKMQKGDVSP